MHGSLNLPAVLPLYLAGVSWTLVYDTIYAHQVRTPPGKSLLYGEDPQGHAVTAVRFWGRVQDKVDDVKVGVRSTALLFGQRTPVWLTGFSLATLAGLGAAGHAVGLGERGGRQEHAKPLTLYKGQKFEGGIGKKQ